MRVPRTFASLRAHRNYRLYFGGQIVSHSGSFMQETALPWLVLGLTHSPVKVGLLVFCRYGPFLVGGLYGGVIADRFDNRRVLIATQAFAMAVALGLTAYAFLGGPLWLVFVLATCTGVQLVFDNPSKHALIYQLVGRDELPNAVALNISLQNSAKIVGPALGGVLIAAVGVGWCFAVNAASFLAVLAALLLMRPAELFPLERDPERPAPVRALREGLAYARSSVQLQTIMAIALVLGFFGFSAMRTLLPVLAETTLGQGPRTFGVLFATYGAGAVTGALLSATSGRTTRRRLFFGAALFSTSILALAPVEQVAIAGILLFLVGVGWSTWSSQAMAQVQLAAPDRLRGRVISLYTYTLLASAPLGGLVGGWLAATGGTELAFGVAGGAGIAVTAGAVLVLRRSRAPAQARALAARAEEPAESLP